MTAGDGATGLSLVDNTFVDASQIAVLLDASSATLRGNSWQGNFMDVQQQRCDGIVALTADDLTGVPNANVWPAANTLTAYDLGFRTLYVPEVETVE